MIDIDHEIERATIHFRDKAKREGKRALSHLYVILDYGGGWRFVVTRPWEIRFHLAETEKKIEIPKVRIAEPVEYDDWGRTIKLAERYATKKLSKKNPCGDCRMCCITLPIEHEKLHKSAHQFCPHLDSCVGGCSIHPVRPDVCRNFECEWLKSQRLNDRMPPEMRPDRCGVMFTAATAANNFDPEVIEAHPDLRWPSNPFDAENVKQHITDLEKFGMRVINITHYE